MLMTVVAAASVLRAASAVVATAAIASSAPRGMSACAPGNRRGPAPSTVVVPVVERFLLESGTRPRLRRLRFPARVRAAVAGRARVRGAAKSFLPFRLRLLLPRVPALPLRRQLPAFRAALLLRRRRAPRPRRHRQQRNFALQRLSLLLLPALRRRVRLTTRLLLRSAPSRRVHRAPSLRREFQRFFVFDRRLGLLIRHGGSAMPPRAVQPQARDASTLKAIRRAKVRVPLKTIEGLRCEARRGRVVPRFVARFKRAWRRRFLNSLGLFDGSHWRRARGEFGRLARRGEFARSGDPGRVVKRSRNCISGRFIPILCERFPRENNRRRALPARPARSSASSNGRGEAYFDEGSSRPKRRSPPRPPLPPPLPPRRPKRPRRHHHYHRAGRSRGPADCDCRSGRDRAEPKGSLAADSWTQAPRELRRRSQVRWPAFRIPRPKRPGRTQRQRVRTAAGPRWRRENLQRRDPAAFGLLSSVAMCSSSSSIPSRKSVT